MANKESTFTNMVTTLVIIMVVAGFALAGVVELTKDAIERAEAEKLKAALKAVLPPFDNDIGSTKEVIALNEKDNLIIYYAKNGDENVGMAVETFTREGFSGFFKIMVGFRPDGSIINTSILEHQETPGLGDKMDAAKSNFAEQFKTKNPAHFQLKTKKDGGDVEAITAATITSNAFCGAVQKAYNELVEMGRIEQ